MCLMTWQIYFYFGTLSFSIILFVVTGWQAIHSHKKNFCDRHTNNSLRILPEFEILIVMNVCSKTYSKEKCNDSDKGGERFI